jgi:GntR family transcriptional regulator
MLFTVRPDDPVPIYQQLMQQVRHAIASGALSNGERLPSQRELARELVVNHLTILKAYNLLEQEGLVKTQRGRGTFVTGQVSEGLHNQAVADLRARAAQIADGARLLGMSRSSFMGLLKNAWDATQPTDGAGAGGEKSGGSRR